MTTEKRYGLSSIGLPIGFLLSYWPLATSKLRKNILSGKKNLKMVLDQAAELAHPVPTEAADLQRSNTTRICRQEQEERDCPTVKAFCQVSVKIYISCSTNWFRIKPVKGEKNWKKI